MSQVRHGQRRKSQQKHRRTATLNLVSLMDIFTILVFFLMVNSSEVEVLETSSKIKLPDSNSQQRPDQQIVISISQNDVIVQGRAIAQVADLKISSEAIIPSLADELGYQAGRKGEMPEDGFAVTIMGDRQLPYWLLKKIMLTCQSADYARISLAVNKMQAQAALDEGGVVESGAAS